MNTFTTNVPTSGFAFTDNVESKKEITEIDLMGELNSLVVLHLMSVNVGFAEVNTRFAEGGLVQYSLRQSLAIHIELEQDIFASLDVLTGVNGYSGAEQHQFVIGWDDSIGNTGTVVNNRSSRVSLPSPLLPAPGARLVPHEDLECIESPVLAPIVGGSSSEFFSLLFFQSFSLETATLRFDVGLGPAIRITLKRLELYYNFTSI